MPELVSYRASSYRTAVRNIRHGEPGRYHESGSERTQYLALHPLGPWAEMARNQACQTLDDALQIRMAIWALRLVLDDDPELVDFDAASAGALPHPISAEELVSDDRRQCQALGDAYRRDPNAAKVIRVPSAALPGTDNIVIFGERKMVRYETEPLRALHVPAALAAVDGRPPQGLWPVIRGFDQPHAALNAWAAGDDYEVPLISTRPL